MCDARGERATFRHPLRSPTLLLEESDALVKLSILYCDSHSTGKCQEQVDVLRIVRVAGEFWAKHEYRKQLGFMNYRAGALSAHRI